MRITAEQELSRLKEAMTEALREIQNCPDDSEIDIINECLESWETGLKMDSSYCIDKAD